jgi:hypothetical protein
MTPIKHGRVAGPLGAADLYLFALMVLLGAAAGLAVQVLNETVQAREEFRDQLWDAGIRLEECDQALADALRKLKDRDEDRDAGDEPARPRGVPQPPAAAS